MRKLSAFISAAALALAPASVFAQALTYVPDQQGAVGTIVTATGSNGQSQQVILPQVQCSNCSGGGSGGAVTGAANAFVDGWSVTHGQKSDGPCASSVTACSIEARLADIEAQITSVKTGVNGPIPTCSGSPNCTGAIGNVGLQFGSTTLTLGQAAKASSVPVTLASDQPNVPAALQPSATAGSTPLFTASLSTTVTQIKASAGAIYMLRCYNPNASAVFIQVFNLPSASVTLGTTTPTQSYGIAASVPGGFASAMPLALGGSGISYAATTTNTGSTAPGSAVSCNVGYQ